MEINYRIGTENDYDALVQFWSDNSGWGTIDRKAWIDRFVKTPEGPASFSLGVDKETDEILSQFLFIPSAITVGDKIVRGYRPFAPVIKESIRNQGTSTLQELIMNMYLLAIATLGNAGGSLIHMLPDPRWLRILRRWPLFQISSMPHCSFPIPLEKTMALNPSYSLEAIDISDPRIDDLWHKARHNYDCMIARTSKTLSYKVSHGDVKLMGVSYQSRLVGMFASMLKSKDKQWLILDLLSEDGEESLEMTLTAAVLYANQQYLSLPEEERGLPKEERSFKKVALLAPPLMQPVLEKIGFSKEKYDYPVLIHLFDPTIAPEEVAPDRWYFSAND